MKRKLLILLFLLSFPSALYVFLSVGRTNFIHVPYYGEKTLGPNGDTIYHTAGPFSFVNQDGKTITERDYYGKICIVDYFFTSCKTICPKMTTELIRVQDKFAYTNGLIQILSHTVDPENDSVPVLKAYSEMVHADTKTWNFVTGDKKQLYDMARNSYLLSATEGNGGADDFIHSEFFVIVDKERHLRGVFDGTNIDDVNKMIDAVKVLMAEYMIKDKVKDKGSPAE
ncbi:MAG: SCO family protein [Bacteroidia bacterium]